MRLLARALAPLFALLTLGALLLPFTSVSVSSVQLRSTLSQLSPVLTDADNACIDALSAKSFVSYSGVSFISGREPSQDNSLPSACTALGGGAAPASPPPPSGSYSVAPQPLLGVVALLVLASLGLGLTRSPYRGAVIAPLLMIALLLAMVAQVVGQSAIASRRGSDEARILDIHPDLGFTLLLVLLGVTAVCHAAHFVLGQRRSTTAAS